MTNSPESFNQEFEYLKSNIDRIYHELTEAINSILVSSNFTDGDRSRMQEMVNAMVEGVMNPQNKKIAFMTFKIVEETVKRACLRTEIDVHSLISYEQLGNMKRSLMDN